MKFRIYVAAFCVCSVFLFVAPTTNANSHSPEAAYQSVLIELIDLLQKQIVLLQKQLESQKEELKTLLEDLD